MLKIGIGGVVGNELLTFDFTKGERLKPYVCKILGRDFTYGLKREFIERNYLSMRKVFYGHEMRAITFPLERFVVYEYIRFPGNTMGEIHDGYFVILSDCIKELEKEEVIHWCGTAKEKQRSKTQGREIFNPKSKYAPDDIDF
jgi:hypothetical protein